MLWDSTAGPQRQEPKLIFVLGPFADVDQSLVCPAMEENPPTVRVAPTEPAAVAPKNFYVAVAVGGLAAASVGSVAFLLLTLVSARLHPCLLWLFCSGIYQAQRLTREKRASVSPTKIGILQYMFLYFA